MLSLLKLADTPPWVVRLAEFLFATFVGSPLYCGFGMPPPGLLLPANLLSRFLPPLFACIWTDGVSAGSKFALDAVYVRPGSLGGFWAMRFDFW